MPSKRCATYWFLSILSLMHAYVLAQDTSPVVEGLPEHLLYIYTKQASEEKPQSAQDQLYDGSRRWEPNRTLRVCLFGGNETVATLIRDVASEWNNYSSVKFDFGPARGWNNCLSPQSGFFQVRIGFSERGYWSVVGKDSEALLDPLAPSMNLENFNRTYSESRISPKAVTSQAHPYHKAVIRHEFGHALGLLHEHQNPSLNCYEEIKWTGTGNVFDYFAGPPNNWTPQQVNRNLGFIGQTDPFFVAGDPDSKSVMLYALPSAIFKSGASSNCYVSGNHEISAKDKQIVAKIYPSSPIADAQRDVDVKTSNVKPLPKFVNEPNREDLRARILVDLESNDKYVRRDARARLADLLEKGASQKEVAGLVSGMSGASYRYQLGVAVALANARGKRLLDATTKQRLNARAESTTDATLKRNLESATK